MKTYKIITLALIAMISFNSCSDFLTTELTDAKKTSDTYYKNSTEAYTALVGCYNGLDLIWNSGVSFPLASEVLSDNCLGGTGASDGYGYQLLNEFNKAISPADVSLYSANWKAYYQAIYRCNVLLSKIDQVAWGDSIVLKKQYKAEAKFIRAFCYFDMARLWEKVPLVTTPTLENVPQADPATIYSQIMSDLRYASDSLPSAVYTSVPSGRVTKWAAESLLARAYLFYDGYYGKGDNTITIGGETGATVLKGLEDVITNSGHDLVSDFNTLWPAASTAKGLTYAGENNKEVVFSIKYSSGEDYNGNITGNEWMVMTGIRGESHYPYQAGWGGCTVDPKLYNTFNSGDSRRFASITAIAEEGINYTASADNREYTGYYLKKYSPLCDKKGKSIVTDFMIGQYQDYFSIRFADVLLMAAELGSKSAQNDFDKVCRRAGMPTGVTPNKANIMAQRQLEFVGEGIRYWDLLRQGISTAASTIANNTTLSFLNDGHTAPTAAQLQANITSTRGFQQIPNDQIT